MNVTRLSACLALAGIGLVLLAGAARAAETAEPADKDPFEKEGEPAVQPLADPLQPVNRAFFVFNDKLYFWALKPVATGYKFVLPQIARVGVRNFFSNLGTPVRLVSCLFQADLRGTGTELARFGFNTTVGVAGFADPAKGWLKLRKREADFGQTFGVWGMGPVLYLNWPLAGPSSVRDTLALPFNAVLDPATFVPGAGLVQRVNYVSLNLGEYEDLKRAALDAYVAVRDAYNQYREHLIRRPPVPGE